MMMSFVPNRFSSRRTIDASYIRTLRSSARRLRELTQLELDQRSANALCDCIDELEREANSLELRDMLRLPWLKPSPDA